MSPPSALPAFALGASALSYVLALVARNLMAHPTRPTLSETPLLPDGDGDVDVITGNFVGFTFTKADTGFKADVALDLWVNAAKQAGGAASGRP